MRPFVVRSSQRLIAAAALLLPAAAAHASFLSGDALDTFAGYMAWVVICVVPVALIVLFWKLHVLPEKIAEARHHPQKDAIHVLCLLSLMVGGLLWPLAWLWAYTRPVAFKAAYGTEKHEDYYVEMADKAKAGELLGQEIAHLREELEVMVSKGLLPPQLKTLREDLVRLHRETEAREAAARSNAEAQGD
jgi:hypothetical protein